MTLPLRFGLVGHPVRHSLSPTMFVAAFREAGLPHGYSLFDAQGDSGFDGVLIEPGAEHHIGEQRQSGVEAFTEQDGADTQEIGAVVNMA